MTTPDLPPCNLDAERAILGALFLRPDLAGDITQVLSSKDFFSEIHQLIFSESIKLLSTLERGIDLIVAIKEKLKELGKLEWAGGPVYLGELIDWCTAVENTPYFCKLVKETSLARQALSITSELTNGLANTGLREALASISQRINQIADEAEKRRSQPIRETDLDKLPEETSAVIWGSNGAPLVMSGLVTILHGREGSAKTWLTLGLARAVSSGNRSFLGIPCCECPVLVVSAEQPDAELNRRLRLIRHNSLPASNLWLLGEEALYAGGPPDLLEQSTVQRIIRCARRCKAGFVIIDPLADMWSGEENNRDYGLLLTALRQLRLETGAGILLTHHEPKPAGGVGAAKPADDKDTLRGGTRLRGGVRSVLRVCVKNGLNCLVHTKSNMGATVETVWLDLEEPWFPRIMQAPDNLQTKKEANLQRIVNALTSSGREMTLGELVTASGVLVSKQTFGSYLKDLENRDAITIIGKNPHCRYEIKL